MSDPRPTPNDPRTTDPDATRNPSTESGGLPDPLRTRDPSPGPDARPGDSLAIRAPDDPHATAMPDTSGRDLGATRLDAVPGYELLGVLGEGGMGVVYKARQERLNRVVALKMMLGEHRAGPKELIRFRAEAEAIASVRHPHVVQVHESGDAEGRPFLAMEYLPGGSLADRLRVEGRSDPRAAALLIAKLSRAVQAAHDQGIVHRDLKPQNVLFDQAGEPKVTDFGLAKRATGSDLTRTQAVMGTPAYMAPEQARGETKFVGPQADVYALGVILYELLAGTRPFDHADTHVLLRRVIEDEPERPDKHVPGLSRDLELIALKCLAKDQADRYQTAGELADDLGRFVSGRPVSVRAASTVERAVKWARRKPTLAAAYALTAAVLLLSAFGASLAVLWRVAERARAMAEVARDAEKKARGEAETNRERLARNEYGRTVQIAHQEWRDNNIVAAMTLLEGTRPDLRGWEWRYVHHLCHGELLTLGGNHSSVNSASFSPDGSRVVTASDETARVWDARSGAETLALKGHTGPVTSASFSPDGSRIVTGSHDETARVWDARSGDQLLTLKGHTYTVNSASFSPDGSRIVTGSSDQTARVWDARSGAELLALKGHTLAVSSASFSPDGSRVVTGNNDGTARVWDARYSAEFLSPKGHTGLEVSSATFSPDGSRVVIKGWDMTERMRDAQSVGMMPLLYGHTDLLTSASFSPDGTRVVTGSDDGTARVWDARSGTLLLALKGHTDLVNSASFSPDGSRVVTGSSDKTARVWDARSGAQLLALKGHKAWMTSASFSPDGSRIVTGSWDLTARVWDARSGAELLALAGHTAVVLSASFSPDGSRIVTGSSDKTARVWDARSGVELLALKGHTGNVTSASFSPDGLRVVSGSWDLTARVWDARSGAELLTLKGHTGAVILASFSPDGSRIVTASHDKTARVWDSRPMSERSAPVGATQ